LAGLVVEGEAVGFDADGRVVPALLPRGRQPHDVRSGLDHACHGGSSLGVRYRLLCSRTSCISTQAASYSQSSIGSAKPKRSFRIASSCSAILWIRCWSLSDLPANTFSRIVAASLMRLLLYVCVANLSPLWTTNTKKSTRGYKAVMEKVGPSKRVR